jgi:class 3 adenylate cyclase
MVGSDQDPSIAVFSWCLSLSAYPLLLWLVQAWDSSVRSSADSVFLLDTVFMTLTLLLFPLPAFSAWAVMLVMAFLSMLCVRSGTGASRVIRMLLVLVMVHNVTPLWLRLTHIGLTESLGFVLLSLMLLMTARLVIGVSQRRSQVHKQVRAAETQAVACLDRARAYLPSQALISEVFDPQPTRLPVVICFTDLVNSTRLGDALNDELFTALLMDYITRIGQIAVVHQGLLDKFTGDGAMIVFGTDPSADLGFEASQCANMALAMRSMMADLQADWQTRLEGNPLDQRIGIHAGVCAVGSIGCPVRQDYTVLGRSVHVAARLEQCARPGEILVSGDFAGLLNSSYRLSPQTPLMISGLKTPLRTSALMA